MADGSPATGVRRFNGSWLMVSLGDSDGDLRLCDETCREVSGLDSLEELRVAVASWLPAATPDTVNETGGLLIADTVGGFLHREMQGEEDLRTRSSSPSGSMIVAPSSWHSMCRAGSSRWTRSSRSPGRSNSRIRRRPATPRSTLRIGSFEVTLEGGRWRIGEGPDPSALYLRRGSTEVLIRSGDEEGRVKTCYSPAPGGWEHCDPVRATSLDLLDVEGRACPPLRSRAPFPAGGRRHPRWRDGGGSRRWRLMDPEASGGADELTYVLTVRDGRPVRPSASGAETTRNDCRESQEGYWHGFPIHQTDPSVSDRYGSGAVARSSQISSSSSEATGWRTNPQPRPPTASLALCPPACGGRRSLTSPPHGWR